MFTAVLTRTGRSALRLTRAHPRRVVVVPTVGAVETTAPGRARVRVDGMVCVACATRTGAAFRRVPGVHGVVVDLDAGTAELQHDSTGVPDTRDLQRVLDHAVVAKPVRRLLARLVAAATGRPEGVR